MSAQLECYFRRQTGHKGKFIAVNYTLLSFIYIAFAQLSAKKTADQ